LWHKIFGSPADQSAKLEEISTRPDEETTTRDSADEQSFLRDTGIEGEPIVDELVQARQRDEFESDSEPELDREQREDGERRPRRSRRRRRGRGGKGESGIEGGQRTRRSQHRSEEHHEDDDDLDADADSENELGFDDSQETITGDAEEVEGGENGNQRSGRSRAALQRSIPSWDEAIGFIVDANMQSRSQRRPAGPPGSRGGSPRGRSRGRRRS
jgi:ribonuclease E